MSFKLRTIYMFFKSKYADNLESSPHLDSTAKTLIHKNLQLG